MWRHTSKLARIHVGVPARARVRKSTASFVSWSSCHSRMLAQQAACSRWSAAFSCGVFFFLDLTAAGCRLDANNAKMCLAQMPDMMCIMSGKISHTKSNMGMSARGDACLIPVFLYGRSLIKTPFLRASGLVDLVSSTTCTAHELLVCPRRWRRLHHAGTPRRARVPHKVCFGQVLPIPIPDPPVDLRRSRRLLGTPVATLAVSPRDGGLGRIVSGPEEQEASAHESVSALTHLVCRVLARHT